MRRRAPLVALACLAAGCAIDRAGTGDPDGAAAPHDAPPPPPADAALDGPAPTGAGLDAPPPCGPLEVCAEDRGDEDCDGEIDEGCPWHFGRPSPLVRLHRSTDFHWSPWLSPDGLRLY